MESNNFISLSKQSGRKLIFGIKMIPDKSMNRLTDKLAVYIEKHINHRDKYYISFSKKCSNDILMDSYMLTKKELKSYIDFLNSFYQNFDLTSGRIEDNFIFEHIGVVSIKILHSDFLKISSASSNTLQQPCLFFILSKNELFSYVNKLKAIYSGKEIDNYFNSSFNAISSPGIRTLTKKERDSLYVNTLYLLADNSLDLKNKKAFNSISKEILKVTSAD